MVGRPIFLLEERRWRCQRSLVLRAELSGADDLLLAVFLEDLARGRSLLCWRRNNDWPFDEAKVKAACGFPLVGHRRGFKSGDSRQSGTDAHATRRRVQWGLSVKSTGGAHAGRQVTSI